MSDASAAGDAPVSPGANREGMRVALVWARSRNGVIGADGGIPWHVPEDLAHFRELTGRSPVVMGRRTWDSLPERFRPLPGRRNIVVTRQNGWTADGAEVAHTLEGALALSRVEGARTVWVIGGGQLYREALPLADIVEETEIDLDIDGDTTAPAMDDGWTTESTPASGWLDSRTGIRYRFLSHRRAG